MVLINEKKYACEKCIKGHRVSGCTHTDRPLYEIKKKGRPTTQCSHCKDKRKTAGSSVHTKCSCGDVKTPSTTSAVIQPIANQSNLSEQTPTLQDVDQDEEIEFETRKGQPGSKATFPRGFKDVLELAAAANALAGLVKEDTPYKVAERSVNALLNPCKCQSGGPCKCCHPKKAERSDQSGDTSPSSGGGCCSTSAAGAGDVVSRPGPPPNAIPYLSPENMHHPAHTSPHVHKTKLFSPYSTNTASQSRHGRRDTISSRSSGRSSPLPSKILRPPPPTIKPLTDFGRLIGAAINQDGSINSEIPRSAVGLPNLPGISTFDTAAENGGAKVEPMEYEDIDIDMPLSFPTSEDVVIGACMCGEDCSCPNCATHDNGITSTNSENGHRHKGGCGESCKGRNDCNHSISVPSGVTSIAHLISLAAAHVPPPPEAQAPRYASALDPHDTRVLPPSAQLSADVARTMGIVQLKPLECCNGRCQCPPGQCVCEKECCGCCVRCACSEEDEDARMSNDDDHTTSQAAVSVASSRPKSSCCGGKQNVDGPNTQPSPVTASPTGATIASSSYQPSPTLLSPGHAQLPLNYGSRQQSPVTSGSTTPVNLPPVSTTTPTNGAAVRRAISISSRSAQEGHDVSSASHRRATVTGNLPAVTGPNSAPIKASSKTINPYNAHHHRTILPKPSNSHLSTNTSATIAGNSRQPSPSGQKRGSTSAGPARNESPSGERRTSGSSVSTRDQMGTSRQYQPSPTVPSQPSQSELPTTNQVDNAHGLPDSGLGYQWPPQYCQEILQSQYPAFGVVSETMNQQTDIASFTNPNQNNYPSSMHILGNGSDIDPSNATLLAFLQQFSQPNSQSSQAGLQHEPAPMPLNQAPPSNPTHSQASLPGPPHFDQSWFSQVQQPALSHDVSGTTSPELDLPFDLDQFLAQTLNSNQAQPHSESNNNQPQHHPGVAADLNPNFNDFFFNNAVTPNVAVQSHSQPNSSGQTNGVQNANNDLVQTDPPFIPLVPGLPIEHTYSPNWTSNGMKEKIVEDQRRQLRETNEITNSHQHQPSRQDILINNQTRRQIETSTGDIIDLSKPLDSDTLNKIMMALQKHNETFIPDSNSSTNAQPNINNELSSQNITNLPDQGVIPNNPNPNGNTKDLDDMFNQFVTLDGVVNSNPNSNSNSNITSNADGMNLNNINEDSNTNTNTNTNTNIIEDPNSWLKIQCNVDGLNWANNEMWGNNSSSSGSNYI
ncbi:uncharacterized protein I206_105392 [Kwoniella pini CBS 10737]|uniref:Copper-fist domain-containing protein n=1 Tax=Kwoniella pini CBS 10737 TaxID=1296096 RepID=A0A1B9I4D5_9TREE|nr:uncharacterized protein I206_03701 [Kwoniella pini CBS 10737]OCF50380.1 hypothetical protein I206_03701 [Kwoniella pini CBS 10737]